MKLCSELDQTDPDYNQKMNDIHYKIEREMSEYNAQRQIDKQRTKDKKKKFESAFYTSMPLTASLMILGAMLLLMQIYPLTIFSIILIIGLSILLSISSAQLIYDTHKYLKKVNLQKESPIIANTLLIGAFIIQYFSKNKRSSNLPDPIKWAIPYGSTCDR